MLDEALLRPGRLEVQVEIGLPDEAGRHQILKVRFCARSRLQGSRARCCWSWTSCPVRLQVAGRGWQGILLAGRITDCVHHHVAPPTPYETWLDQAQLD